MAKVNKTFVDGQPLTAADMNAINSAAGAVGNATTTAELASVVAGQMYKKQLKNTDDFDNITESGLYYCHYSSVPSHSPSNWGGSGTLEVKKQPNHIIQILYNESGGDMWNRYKWGTAAFTKWFKVTSSVVEYR